MKIRIAAFLLLLSVQVHAAERGFYVSGTAAAGINPIISSASADIFYRIPLSSDPGPLWNSTSIDLGFDGSVTPVDYNVATFINIEPVAVFNLKLTASLQRYYTAAGYGYYRMESPDSDYSYSAQSDIEGESKTAYKFSAEPTLKFRYGRVIFGNTFTFNYINTQTNDEYYYEPYSDSIHKSEDTDYSNSTSLLFEVRSGLLAGVNNFYSRTGSVDCTSNRVSGIIIWTPAIEYEGEITLGALAGSYNENRNYKGDLFALAFVTYKMKNDIKE